jgi:hypothetical protein
LNSNSAYNDDLREGTIFDMSYNLAPETYFDVLSIDLLGTIIIQQISDKDVTNLLKSVGKVSKNVPWKHLIKLEYPRTYNEIYRVYPYMFVKPGWKGLYLALKYINPESLLFNIDDTFFKYTKSYDVNLSPVLKEFLSILWLLHNFEYAFEIGGKDQEFRGRLIEFADKPIIDPDYVNLEYFLKTGSLSSPYVYTGRKAFYPIISSASVLYKFLSDPHVSYQDAYALWNAITNLKTHGIKDNIDYFKMYIRKIRAMKSPLLESILQENPSQYFIASLTYQRTVKDILEVI